MSVNYSTTVKITPPRDAPGESAHRQKRTDNKQTPNKAVGSIGVAVDGRAGRTVGTPNRKVDQSKALQRSKEAILSTYSPPKSSLNHNKSKSNKKTAVSRPKRRIGGFFADSDNNDGC